MIVPVSIEAMYQRATGQREPGGLGRIGLPGSIAASPQRGLDLLHQLTPFSWAQKLLTVDEEGHLELSLRRVGVLCCIYLLCRDWFNQTGTDGFQGKKVEQLG